ncbi:gas vesicle protein [Streptacidiphilus griseoplanus]|uniref:gas vesicle protein n=1 Tax=Peterkaempfera griseoplana TaxID=66896 RepID=UPI00099E842D|nr:gas vesicle protein [Peterkaempfera griseoplana]
MTEPVPSRLGAIPSRAQPYGQGSSANLADILERVLDKGIVIAGDIQINLLDIELLTIKLRLVVASVDKAKEMGIDWWEHDPSLSSRAGGSRSLAEENRRLRAEIEALRETVALPPAEEEPAEPVDPPATPARRPKPRTSASGTSASGTATPRTSASRTSTARTSTPRTSPHRTSSRREPR